MTARIREFLKHRTDEGPCLVVDLEVVRENYLAFAKSLPDSKVFYAVKANPAPDILKLLVELGACFDVASLAETQAVLAAGAAAGRISYGNTIKKESEIAAAFALGVTLYAVDCEAEVGRVARRSPADEVRCVYLDIGKFHGLAETIAESIRYPIRTKKDRDEMAPCIIAGPTCDSVDVLYEKNPYPLPVSLAIGDKVLIEAAGAYTATYSSIGFNGYPPLRQYVI